MSAVILNGRKISKQVQEEIQEEISQFIANGKRAPKLGVILVGEDIASALYVKNKQKACAQIGIESFTKEVSSSVTHHELMQIIENMNRDTSIDGILLQLPLPEHLRSNEAEFLSAIHPSKDVDGFHPVNIGRLVLGLPAPISCTPAGVMRLLEETHVDLEGKLCIILGRSNTVGKPLIQLLLQKNATVISCHSKTRNLSDLTQQADILIAAVGKHSMVQADMIKPGAIVIDVGINRLEDGSVRGDVDFAHVKEKASWITKVPGGVGPMTIAMLLKNTVFCYKNRKEAEDAYMA